jgi:hypothetical protein
MRRTPGRRAAGVASTDLAADERRRRGHQADAPDREQRLEHVDDLRSGEGIVADLSKDDVVEERA